MYVCGHHISPEKFVALKFSNPKNQTKIVKLIKKNVLISCRLFRKKGRNTEKLKLRHYVLIKSLSLLSFFFHGQNGTKQLLFGHLFFFLKLLLPPIFPDSPSSSSSFFLISISILKISFEKNKNGSIVS